MAEGLGEERGGGSRGYMDVVQTSGSNQRVVADWATDDEGRLCPHEAIERPDWHLVSASRGWRTRRNDR